MNSNRVCSLPFLIECTRHKRNVVWVITSADKVAGESWYISIGERNVRNSIIVDTSIHFSIDK